ncbi:hypothetical protein [Marinoscillum sp.]|uniref:hypothetical protein n=1 Tax=Marinoscillum sp. TaxID=2024838 RepID=UPI003BAB3D72
MKNDIQGVIWFDQEFQGGLMEDFEAYTMVNKEPSLSMYLYVSSPKQIAEIARTLNNSNLRSWGKN